MADNSHARQRKEASRHVCSGLWITLIGRLPRRMVAVIMMMMRVVVVVVVARDGVDVGLSLITDVGLMNGCLLISGFSFLL